MHRSKDSYNLPSVFFNDNVKQILRNQLKNTIKSQCNHAVNLCSVPIYIHILHRIHSFKLKVFIFINHSVHAEITHN